MIQKAKPYLRRFFALFLAACLMVGYVPTDALAASPDTATETIAETVTDETSADDNAPAEEPNTQKPDTSASAETPPQGNGVDAEKPNSSQQSSAENAENTEQPPNNTANSSEQTPAAPTETTAPAGTASNSSVIGAPTPDDSDDENFQEMTPEEEAELKASLEAAGIDTSNLDLRSLTPEDIQKLLNDPSYDINATAEGPGGGWKDYSGQACIRATNGRVPGIGASTDGALTYHTWNPNGNPTRNDFATCLQSDRVWRSGDNLWNWSEVTADGWDETPTQAWSSLDYQTRQWLVLLAHYGLGGGASKFSGSNAAVYAAMQLLAWQWTNGAGLGTYTSHYSQEVQDIAYELTVCVFTNPDNIDASQSTVYLIWPNAQTKFNSRLVWGQSLMKPATLVYAGPTTGILSLRKVSANDAVTNGNSYYSLSGAAYGVYSDSGCTNQVTTLTTDGSGNASAELELGTYYVKEISASTGYQLDTNVYTVDLDGDKSLTVKENPRTANINLNKTSLIPDMTNGNNCYSLSGAVYGVYSDAACNNLVTTMTTDGSGNASTNLYLNTYYVKEITASKGYQLDTTVYTVNLSNDTNLGVKEKPKDDPVGIRVTKIAEGVSGNIPSLAGTQFTVKFYAGQYTADNLPGSATRTWVIETKQVGSSYVAFLGDDYKVSGDAFYRDVTSRVTIPLGTITIQETMPATGYTTEGAIVTSAGQTVTENNGIVVLNITENANGAALNYGNVYTKTDKVIRGGIEVQKHDRETNGTTPLGGGSFAGITFTIVNNNDYSVEVDGQSRAKGEVVATLTTNANGYAATAPDALPYGSYIVTETALPENSGYRLTATPVTVFVTENGVLVHADFANDLIRSELRFVKVDGNTGEHLSNIPFRVTDKKTGESHIIVTDVNGIFDSSVYTNKQRNNANDAAVAADGTVDEALLDSNSGVWFSGSLTQRPAVDGLNSFPYGTYVVEELLTSKNSDYTMISFEFTVYRDAEVLDIGTVDNNRGDAYFSTYLTDKDTNGKIASTSKNTTLVDEIEFGGLTVGREYTLDGKLYATDDLNTVIATASMTFTADVITGTKRLEFTFDSTGMEGKDIVAFVTLSKGNQNLFVSDDPANADETVHFAGIRTTAMGSNDEKEIVAGPKAVVVDKVSYYGLTPGVTYVLKGSLMNYETGEVARDSNGVAITAETSFKPTTGDGVVDVVFNFDASTMGGMNLVAFEQLTRNTAIVAVHEDLQDAEQTVAVPKVGTTLKNEDGGKTAAADTTVTLIDTVAYSGVIVGKQYTVTGTLMDKATGKAVVDANGAVVTATKTFTAEAVEGTVDISFTFDSSVVAGNAVVAFEELSNGVRVIAEHKDINDEDQTVKIPHIRTTASDRDGNKEILADGSVVIQDTVSYDGLPVANADDTYTMTGTLMDKETGESVKDASGNPITASTSFHNTTENGTVILEFRVSNAAAVLEGKTVVVFEVITDKDGKEIAKHEDIEDKDQTVHFPGVKTTAADEAGSKELLASGKMTVVDNVEVTNVTPGNEYTIKGTLIDKATGETAVDAAGKPITSSVTFVPTTANGSITLTFTFDGSNFEGKTLVAFEKLYDMDNRLVGNHENPDDKDQTVTVPKIRTTFVGENGLHVVKGGADALTLIDTVSYENLVPGKTYTLNGVLMGKNTGEKVICTVSGGEEEITASTTFTPDTPNGTVDVVFTVPVPYASVDGGDGLSDMSLVAFETLVNAEAKTVAAHEDIKDEGQTIYIVSIGTSLKDANNYKEFNATNATGKITVIDTVTYRNLIPGTKYTVKGTLMNKATGEAAVDASGSTISAETSFTPNTADGTINLPFTFNASNMEGVSLVAFEQLFSGEAEIADHKDLEDKDQTVTFPKVRTTAHSEKGDDEFLASDPIKLIDTVAYENLIPGKSYTLIGTVMDKDSRTLLGKIKPLTVGGEVVTATVTFTPENANGTVDVVFEFNGEQLGNKSLVVFETLYDTDSRVVGTHEDENDEKQDFTVPAISTSLKADNGLHLAKPNEEMTLTDTVTYKNLVVGKQYTAKGTLMDKTTGKPVVGKDGKVITAEKTFTPDTKDGTIDLVFTFNASDLAGESVVAFEKVENRFGAVAVHEDLKDEEQTVHFPKVRTTAADANGEKEFNATGKLTIIDKVTYENLIPGTKYTVKGTLMDKDAGKAAVDASGKEITAEATFTPATASGSVNLSFTFNASNMEGKSLVAFEKLFSGGAEIAGHEDFEDKEQTVTFPKVRTTAHSEKGDDEFLAADSIKLIDTVTYENLIPGKSYTVIGTIMDKGSRTLLGKIKPLTDNGEAIVSSVTFVPEEANGSVDVVFQFNGEALGNKSFVVFETLYDVNNRIVGSHEDENDKDQDFTVPKISTSLKDNNGLHVTKPSEEMTLTDTVTYKNLVVGKQYTAKGTLMNKSTGEPVVDKDGKEITAETTFTPAEKDGTVDLVFKFDASELAGESVVAFEKVANEFGVIAVHEDLEDEEQTVHCPAIKTTASDANGNKDFYAHDTVSVVDTIEYKNLAVGLRYTVEGTLMDKATGEAITDEKGEAITAKTSFTPKAPDGTVNITFRFKADDMEGKTLVAFEVLTTKNVKGEDTPVASHEDIEDEDQTVHFPKVHTTAVAENDEHLSMPNDPTKIVDRVYYENLLVGETYEVVGTLMNKATGKPIKDNDKDVIESRVTFVAEKADGYIDIEFNINASEFLNNTLVAFEELYHDSRLVGTHKNMEDEDQSVHFPKIRTSAAFEDGTRVLKTQVDTEVVTIIDTVSYENLIPGKTYKVSGTLMNKEDEGVLRNAEGEIYIADAEFTPEAASGTVDVTFKVQIGDIIGKKTVVFESLMVNGKTIAEHKDINDNDQTVTTPYVTKAFKYDASTEKPLAGAYFSVTDQGPVDEKSTDKMLLDVQTVVSDEDGNIYFNALPGHEYAIKETKAPDGYTLDTETYFVTVDEKGNADVELRIANVRGGTVVIKKIDVITGDPLKGCEITVYRILEGGKREEVFKQQTDAKGLIYFHTDVPGEYVYKETVSIDGYYLNSDEQYFKIGEDGRISGELILANVPWGTVVLTKTDPKGTPLAGAQFNVYAEDNTLLGVAVTNEKGRIYFVSPGPGKYYFVETKAPRGYRINTEKHYFVVGADNSITGSTSLVNGLTGVKTGDNNNATLWLASGAGSMFAIAGIGYVIYANEKKRRKAQN